MHIIKKAGLSKVDLQLNWKENQKMINALSASGFDWISLIYIIIIVLLAAIGFIRGGIKTALSVAAIAISIGLAFALYGVIGGAVAESSVGEQISSSTENYILDNVSGSGILIPAEVFKSEWVANGMLSYGYSELNIPEFVHEPLNGLIVANLPTQGMFTPASAIAHSLTLVTCSAIGFVSTFLVCFIVIRIVLAIVFHFAKKNLAVGAISRILGLAIGLVEAFAVCWVISLVCYFFVSSGSDIGNYIADVTKLNQDGFGIAKWFISTDLGYSSVLSFLK